MNRRSLLLVCMIAAAACNDQAGSANHPHQVGGAGDSPVVQIQIPRSACYLSVTGKDSIALKVERFPNVVTGVLRYGFHEKDASLGELEGRLHGDTLVADYTFTSEGKQSVRPVIFLLGDSIATEGYGEVVERDGKSRFENPGGIDFSKGLVLHQIACTDYDPASQLHSASPPRPAAAQTRSQSDTARLSGTWELNYISGPRIAFQGLYPDRKPFIRFNSDNHSQLSGNTSCNNFRCGVRIDDRNIHFDELISTKMACPGQGEQIFVNMLKKVNRYTITNDTFTLLIGDVAVMRFRQK